MILARLSSRPVAALALLSAVLPALLPAAGLSAQTVDPRVLQQLQGQLGAGGATARPDPVDAARSAGQAATGTPATPPGARIDTREEQELRRAEARARLDRLYRASPVEREFRDRLADPTLRQFGYDLFESATAGGGAVTGAVSDDYVIGVGDDIVVQFQGATNDSQTVRVNRDGRLIVGALPPVPAAGRSLAAVRRDLAAATRRTLLGTDVYLSLGSVRAVTVFVGGEVARPGQYNLTALSDVSAALSQAGGVRRSGSLRNVRIVRGSSSIAVDLYGLLGIGAPPSVRLRDGDRIIVPVIGDTVAIAGSVARPGIYEVRRGTSLAQLLDYAGGALRPRGNRIAISRITADGSEEYLRVPSVSAALIPGDAVQVTGGSAGGATGRVALRGHVLNPGVRALVAAPTVRDLVGDVTDLRNDTYLPMAVLVRRDPATAARQFQPVNLVEALASRPGVALRSDDRLFVFGRDDIDFLSSLAVRRVVLGQPNPLPECAALERLETLVQSGQTARFNVVTRGSYIVERAGQSDIAAAGGSVAVATRAGEAALRSGADAGGRPVPLSAAAREDSNPLRENIYRDGDLTEADDVARSRTRERRRAATCPAIFDEEPELLPVLIENSVAVGGVVRRPGAYPIAGDVAADVLASVAEGLLPGTSDLSLDVTRAQDGAAVQQRLAAGNGTVLAATVLRPGDDLRFNAAQVQFEAGGVLLTGEFNRPGLYTIRKGETLGQLIARAGGLSPLAYPYGAVFTRRAVKELQQEGLRRTSRELSSALLAVTARKTNTSSDGILAGQQLIRQLETTETLGRVVVEADPRVLAQRPDLDTVLESGDAIVMPKRPSFVLALGDVANPGAVQFINGKTAAAYLSETGGTQRTADRKRIFVVLPNGSTVPIAGGRGWSRSSDPVIPPGSTIIVPKNIDPLYGLEVARDITGIIGGLLTSVATLAILATN